MRLWLEALCFYLCMSYLYCHVVYRLQEDPPPGVSAAPTENNIMLWNAIIFGWAWFLELFNRKMCSLSSNMHCLVNKYHSVILNQIKAQVAHVWLSVNQNTFIYIVPCVASESEAHGSPMLPILTLYSHRQHHSQKSWWLSGQ